MTDDLDPSRLLASAALDNEITPDERAQVEASPALRNEVQVYRMIAAELRAVEVPVAARESAMTAALAAFAELPTDVAAEPAVSVPAAAAGTAAAGTATAGRVVSLHARRQRQSRWLGGAAAAAVVGILGLAAIKADIGGSDSKSASLATTAAFDQEAAGTAAKAAPDVPLAGAAMSTAAAAETVALADPWAAAPSLTTAAELVSFARTLPASLPGSAATTAEATTDNTATVLPAAGPVADDGACTTPTGTVAVPVTYLGQQVYVLRDDAAGVVRVLDPYTCAETATVALG